MATSPSLPSYDPRVIEQFAENLYRKASAFVVGSVVIGAALGAAFGAIPLTSLGDAWPIPSIFGFATLLVGGIVGALVGYVIGDTRSFGYRLQAQSALCQLQTERNTATLARAVAAARQSPQQRVVPGPAEPRTPVPSAPAAQQPSAPPLAPPLEPPVVPPAAPPRRETVPVAPTGPPPVVDPALAPDEPPLSPPISARVA